jgi:hypothetical protein
VFNTDTHTLRTATYADCAAGKGGGGCVIVALIAHIVSNEGGAALKDRTKHSFPAEPKRFHTGRLYGRARRSRLPSSGPPEHRVGLGGANHIHAGNATIDPELDDGDARP